MVDVKGKKMIYMTGGWGYGNRGDNAILAGTLKLLSAIRTDFDVNLTSYSPLEIAEMHGMAAAPSLHRQVVLQSRLPGWITRRLRHERLLDGLEEYVNGSSTMPEVLRGQRRMIESSELVVLSGGGYLNDQWRSMLLAQCALIRISHEIGKPQVILGQTIGPFGNGAAFDYLRKYLPLVDKVLVRDQGSFQVATRAGVGRSTLRQIADMATLLTFSPASPASHSGITVGVMVQNYRRSYGPMGANSNPKFNRKSYFRAVLEVLKMVGLAGVRFRLIPSTTWDEPLLGELHREITRSGFESDIIVSPTLSDYVISCQTVDVMFSTNMHPIILASTAGKPSVALAYSFKVDDYMDSIGLRDFVHRIDNFDPENVAADILRMVDERQSLSAMVTQKLKDVSDHASSAAKELRQLLGVESQ